MNVRDLSYNKNIIIITLRYVKKFWTKNLKNNTENRNMIFFKYAKSC